MFKQITENHRKTLIKLIFLGIFILFSYLLSRNISNKTLMMIIFLAIYLLAGWEIITKGIKGVINGQALDENFLMSIASLAAFALGEYVEAIAVMLFYSFGELFEEIASYRSRKNIENLINLVPDIANIVNENGEISQVDLDDIKVGDILLIRDGEKVGVDGVVVEGEGLIDTSSVTGESMPVEVSIGSEIISSSIMKEGIIKIRAEKEFEDSLAAKIMELIEDSATSKSQSEKTVSRFAKVYTPIVVGIALLVAIVPPVFFNKNLYDYIFRAATFLVISCPCALVLSVPLTFMSGLGLSSKNGILIKGSQCFEALDKSKVLLSDKTGTLTTGEFELKDIIYYGEEDKEKILDYIYNMELMSTHPIAQAIVKSLDREEKPQLFKEISNEKGLGVKAETNDGRLIKLGSKKFVEFDQEENQRAIYLSIDGKICAKIIIEDQIKANSKKTLQRLKKHFTDLAIVSGDSEIPVKETSKALGLDKYYAEVMPDEKLKIMENYQQSGQKVVFVGDGINDAPVLTKADLGISMGEGASDLAIESSDILIVNGEFEQMGKLMDIADVTNKTVKNNIIFILSIKIAILILGLLGFANMWLAIFGDVGVSIIAVLYSMRILKIKI